MWRSQREHSSNRSRAAKIKESNKDLKGGRESKGGERAGNWFKSKKRKRKKDELGHLWVIFRSSRSLGVSEQEREVAILGRKTEKKVWANVLTSGEQGYERVRARWGKVAQANRLHSIYKSPEWNFTWGGRALGNGTGCWWAALMCTARSPLRLGAGNPKLGLLNLCHSGLVLVPEIFTWSLAYIGL